MYFQSNSIPLGKTTADLITSPQLVIDNPMSIYFRNKKNDGNSIGSGVKGCVNIFNTKLRENLRFDMERETLQKKNRQENGFKTTHNLNDRIIDNSGNRNDSNQKVNVLALQTQTMNQNGKKRIAPVLMSKSNGQKEGQHNRNQENQPIISSSTSFLSQQQRMGVTEGCHKRKNVDGMSVHIHYDKTDNVNLHIKYPSYPGQNTSSSSSSSALSSPSSSFQLKSHILESPVVTSTVVVNSTGVDYNLGLSTCTMIHGQIIQLPKTIKQNSCTHLTHLVKLSKTVNGSSNCNSSSITENEDKNNRDHIMWKSIINGQVACISAGVVSINLKNKYKKCDEDDIEIKNIDNTEIGIVAAGCNDGSLHLMSSYTGIRLFPPIIIGSPIIFTDCLPTYHGM
jgi:hypothetical protein